MNQTNVTSTGICSKSRFVGYWRAILSITAISLCYVYFFRPGYIERDLPTSITALVAVILLTAFWTYCACHNDVQAAANAEISSLKETVNKLSRLNEQLQRNNSLLEHKYAEVKEVADEYREKFDAYVAQRNAQAEKIAQDLIKTYVFERESEIEEKLRELNLVIEDLDEEKEQLQLQRQSLAEAEQELQIDYEKFEDLQEQVEKLKNEIRGLLNANLRHRTRAVYSEKIKNEFKELIVSSGLKTQAQCTTWERSVANRVKQEIESKFNQSGANKKN